MTINTLDLSVTLALHWTERVKALSPDISRIIYAELNEYRFYRQACSAISQLHSAMTDPHTAYQYHDQKPEIAEKLAYPVECLIYRLQQMATKASGERLLEIHGMLCCLNKVSDYMLPIAVPVGVYFPGCKPPRRLRAITFWILVGLMAASTLALIIKINI